MIRQMCGVSRKRRRWGWSGGCAVFLGKDGDEDDQADVRCFPDKTEMMMIRRMCGVSRKRQRWGWHIRLIILISVFSEKHRTSAWSSSSPSFPRNTAHPPDHPHLRLFRETPHIGRIIFISVFSEKHRPPSADACCTSQPAASDMKWGERWRPPSADACCTSQPAASDMKRGERWRPPSADACCTSQPAASDMKRGERWRPPYLQCSPRAPIQIWALEYVFYKNFSGWGDMAKVLCIFCAGNVDHIHQTRHEHNVPFRCCPYATPHFELPTPLEPVDSGILLVPWCLPGWASLAGTLELIVHSESIKQDVGTVS